MKKSEVAVGDWIIVDTLDDKHARIAQVVRILDQSVVWERGIPGRTKESGRRRIDTLPFVFRSQIFASYFHRQALKLEEERRWKIALAKSDAKVEMERALAEIAALAQI